MWLSRFRVFTWNSGINVKHIQRESAQSIKFIHLGKVAQHNVKSIFVVAKIFQEYENILLKHTKIKVICPFCIELQINNEWCIVQ